MKKALSLLVIFLGCSLYAQTQDPAVSAGTTLLNNLNGSFGKNVPEEAVAVGENMYEIDNLKGNEGFKEIFYVDTNFIVIAHGLLHQSAYADVSKAMILTFVESITAVLGDSQKIKYGFSWNYRGKQLILTTPVNSNPNDNSGGWGFMVLLQEK